MNEAAPHGGSRAELGGSPDARAELGGTGTHGGWRAALELHLQNLEGRTRIVHRRHHGPLLVQRAFYPEAGSPAGEPCHVYLIHPPGGVAAGDELELRVHVGHGAHALLTTPAAGKFYRRGSGGAARLSQSLRVDNGVLEWLPQENIFYPDAAVEITTRAHVAGDARFIGWEIGCLGLPTRGLTLQGGEVSQSLELWCDGRPLFIDRARLDESCLKARWGMAHHAAFGSWLAFPSSVRELELARSVAATSHSIAATYCEGLTLACTLVDGILVCRGHAMRSDRLKHAFVALWRALRPALLGREAVPPRIWAT